ncbi:MAG TPA: DUF1993 domain-containing protein [Polyangiaceae bacterium]|jgi:hypothetical protein
MSQLSLYQTSVPVFVHGLKVLAAELEAAAASATARGFSSDVFVDARLYPDMLPLAGQVQRASDTSKFSAERLSGVKSPRFEDKERTFAELAQRIQGTIDYLAGVEPAHFEGMGDAPVVVQLGSFSREKYLLDFALPNFFFHLATAHAILRHNGVPLGKLDYLGFKAP